jgi:methylmalonyl-CoA carboxyltransferase large subunit
MDTTELRNALDDIRRSLCDLARRIERLESAATTPLTTAVGGPASTAVSPAAVSPAAGDDVSEEIMLVIAAAVAAFCGERAHLRQVRLISSQAWAQQGRVSVQASHRLER